MKAGYILTLKDVDLESGHHKAFQLLKKLQIEFGMDGSEWSGQTEQLMKDIYRGMQWAPGWKRSTTVRIGRYCELCQ